MERLKFWKIREPKTLKLAAICLQLGIKARGTANPWTVMKFPKGEKMKPFHFQPIHFTATPTL
jgi:hypothetical protein